MVNSITGKIIGAGIEVHRFLGPGLLESTYEACPAAELRHQGLQVRGQVPVRIVYRGIDLRAGYRTDLIVEEKVIVEVKAVPALIPVFTSQMMTYLRLGGFQVGLLLNMNVEALAAGGIKRIVWGERVPSVSSEPSVQIR